MNAPRSRRDFVRTLAIAPALGAIAGAEADEVPADRKSVVDARMDLVVARFGEHLDADARKAVRAEVADIALRAERLRSFPLDNGDGPSPVFTPDRAAPG